MKTVQNQESTRKIKILFDKADKLTMNFTMNQKIAYSNCQREIEDKWQIVKEKPFDFFINDKIDDDKLKEAYKSTARSLGVRIY